MDNESVLHFLLIYDLELRKLLSTESFESIDQAIHAYEQAELEYLGTGQREIVLVGADSIETVIMTHGAYFEEGQRTPRAGLTVRLSPN